MSEQLRIGDADRERAQEALGDHYAAGRLDHDEYAQRLDQVWAARTQAEIDPVFRDLPGWAGAAPYSTPQARLPHRAAANRRRPRLPAPVLVLLVVLGAVVVATNLPVILVGLGVWFFFLRGGCGRQVHTRRW